MDISVIGTLYYLTAIIAPIAVVILLTMLVIEIKKANRLKRANIAAQLRRQFMDLQSVLARNEDLADLYQRGLRGFTGLSDTEQTRFFIVAGYAFTHWSVVERFANNGLVSMRYWDEVLNQLRDFVQYPGVQEYWNYRKHWYGPEFQALVDDLIKDAPKKVKPLYPEPSV
jgi:hypothetical protein